MSYCTECGTALAPAAKFCTSCGTAVAQSAPPAEAVTPVASPVTVVDVGSSAGFLAPPAQPATQVAPPTAPAPPSIPSHAPTHGAETGPAVGRDLIDEAVGQAAQGQRSAAETVTPAAPPVVDPYAQTPGAYAPTAPASPPVTVPNALRAKMGDPRLTRHADFGALTGQDVIAAATTALISLAVTVAIALGAVLVMITGLPEGSRGAIADWFRTAVSMTAMAVGAPFVIEGFLPVNFGWWKYQLQGDLSVRAVPLLLTGVLIAALAATTWYVERSSPAAPAVRILRAILAGGILALALTALSILGGGSLPFQSKPGAPQTWLDGLEGRPELIWVVLGSFVLATTVVGLASWVQASRAAEHASDQEAAPISPWLMHARTAVEIAAAMFVVGLVALAVAAARSGTLDSPNADIPLGTFIAFAPNLLAATTALALGGSLRADGHMSATWSVASRTPAEQESFDRSVGLLTGGIDPVRVLPLLLLVLLATTIVATRSTLRRPSSSGVFERLWQPVALIAAFWAVIALVAGVSARSTGLGGERDGLGVDIAADGAAAIGLPSVTLMAAFWTAAALVLARILTPRIAGAAPAGFARWGGRDIDPTWRVLLTDSLLRRGRPVPAHLEDVATALRTGSVAPPATPLRSDPQFDAGIRVAALGIAGALVAGVVAYLALSMTYYTPEATTSRYLGAVEGRNAERALEQVSVTGELNRAALNDAAMGQLPAWEVTDSTGSDSDDSSSRSVPVRFTLDGATEERTYTLQREGTAWGLFDTWKVIDPFATVNVQTGAGVRPGTVKIGEATIPAPSDDATLASLSVFPGVVAVSAGAQPFYDAPAPVTVNALGTDSESVQLEATLGATAQQAAQKAVNARVDACVKQPVANPQGCNIAVSSDIENITWKVLEYPVASVSAAGDSLFVNANEGVVEYSGRWSTSSWFGSGPVTDKVTASVSGLLVDDGQGGLRFDES